MPAKGWKFPDKSKKILKKLLTKYFVHRGQKVGDWTVLKETQKMHNQRRCLCRCVCGAKKIVAITHLVHGHSTCCIKCAGKKLSNKKYKNKYTHGGRRVKWIARKMNDLFKKQKGMCPICLRALPKNLSNCMWDHNHINGEGRSLLHRGCNVFIGFIENHSGVLTRSERYLNV